MDHEYDMCAACERAHDHMACAQCLRLRLALVAGVDKAPTMMSDREVCPANDYRPERAEGAGDTCA